MPKLLLNLGVYVCSDSLTGFSPSFAAQSPAEQQKQVNSLLQCVAQLRAEASAAAASAATAVAAGEAIAPVGSGCAEAKPALAAVVSQALSRLSSLSVGGAGSGAAGSAATSECGSSDDEGRSYAWTPEQQAAVCTLRELCALPADASDAFLAHLLASKGGGSLEAAAAWMLECEDLEAEEAGWRQAVQRRREERAREAVERGATKKQIVERFALQVHPCLHCRVAEPQATWLRSAVGATWAQRLCRADKNGDRLQCHPHPLILTAPGCQQVQSARCVCPCRQCPTAAVLARGSRQRCRPGVPAARPSAAATVARSGTVTAWWPPGLGRSTFWRPR